MSTPQFTVGDRTPIHCPNCGRPLVVRRSMASDNLYLSCSGWPECIYSRDMPDALFEPPAAQPSLFTIQE